MNCAASFPKRVTLEFTNRCNRTCLDCPRHKMTYPLGDMNLCLFTRTVMQLPTETVVVPFFRGESLMHPLFPTYMKYLRGFREVQLATNADYLNSRNQEAILNNCTFFSVSLHKYQLPTKRLVDFFRKCWKQGVTTQISILDSQLPPDSKDEFAEKWLRHVDRFRIYQTHSVEGFGNMGPTANSSCPKPFEELIVFWNGHVGLCNHDWNNSTLLGDLNMQKIDELWNSMPYQEVRRLHNAGFRRAVAVCESCSFEAHQIYGEVIVNG